MNAMKMIMLLLVPVFLAACGKPIASACTITGSGFTASHDCRHKCLFYNGIRCPDGEEVVPKICSGATGCQPGSCPQGQACYSVDDPFDQVSYCVPATLCGDYSPEALSRWEHSSRAQAEETRAEWARRRPSTKLVPTEVPNLTPSI